MSLYSFTFTVNKLEFTLHTAINNEVNTVDFNDLWYWK